MGWGQRCEGNPELSPKAAAAGIHYPQGDMFIVSVSHCRPRGGSSSQWGPPAIWTGYGLPIQPHTMAALKLPFLGPPRTKPGP